MYPSDEASPASAAETLENAPAFPTDSCDKDVADVASAPEAAMDVDVVPPVGVDGACSSRSQAEADHHSLADELFEKGSKAIEDEDFVTAVDCLSRALEFRVSHYGELAPECTSAYYKYGCALLYKAQEEADPVGNVPKEPPASAPSGTVGQKEKDGHLGTSVTICEQDPAANNVVEDKGKDENIGGDQEAGDSDDDDEDVTEGDEDDESDLDLSWKMLDIARAISEKCSGDTMEKAKIFSALAEVSMEREDFETSLADYQRALSIVENLVEPAHRRIIELNFRICLVLEVGSKTEEAIPYCEKAITLCKTRLQYLKDELSKMQNATPLSHSGYSIKVTENNNDLADTPESDPSLQEKEEEIQVISGFQAELEKKLEDLQQAIANPKSILSEYLKMVSAKASEGKDGSNQESTSFSCSSQIGTILDSPAVSTAATNGNVTHLGVVGRGVKRASVVPVAAEPTKKPAFDLPENASSSAAENPGNAEGSTE